MPTAPPTVPSERLAMLQAGRGIAAILVVLFHATILAESPQFWHRSIFGGVFLFGNAGVDFFFVLSGFIILHAHRGDLGHPARLKRYLWKRFTRIYPLYWIITFVAAALLVATHNPAQSLIPNSIALIGVRPDAVLAVAWTLFHEILFYLLFAVVLVAPRIGGTALFLWWAACLPFVVAPEPFYGLSPINILFGFGMAASVVARRFAVPSLLLPLGAALFLGFGIVVSAGHVASLAAQHLGFGAASALAICGAVSLERRKGIKPPRLLGRVGDSSYALYLIHYPLLSLLARIWLKLPVLRTAPVELVFPILVTICVGAGWLVHITIERPVGRWLARRTHATARPAGVVLATRPAAPRL